MMHSYLSSSELQSMFTVVDNFVGSLDGKHCHHKISTLPMSTPAVFYLAKCTLFGNWLLLLQNSALNFAQSWFVLNWRCLKVIALTRQAAISLIKINIYTTVLQH